MFQALHHPPAYRQTKLPNHCIAKKRRVKNNARRDIIIAVDGPAGAGKSTVTKLVAKKLRFLYIDTGALYRALTLKAKRLNLNLKNKKVITALIKKTDIKLIYNKNLLKVKLDNYDVTKEIRKLYITDGVSEVAKIKEVRQIMTELQRKLAKNNNSILEGRDIGTVVFPNANFKFYLDADFRERVRRRFKELKEKNKNIKTKLVKNNLSTRDKMDSTRKIAPLKMAKDAIYIDTTDLSIKEVVDRILSWIRI
ncbi:(d)CMP kinase [bacterium]|nr:(d)CMP kinase [bacterium]